MNKILFAMAALPLFAQPADPLATMRKTHPRLIALDSDIERIQKLTADDAIARGMFERMRKQAAVNLRAPLPSYTVVGPRMSGGGTGDRVIPLAFLYRFDPKPEYKERILAELRAAASFPDWNPSHFLDTAGMTEVFAIAYDWMYNAFSTEERAWIRKEIVTKGINESLPEYKGQRWWVIREFNWNQACNAGMTLGALAVAEDEPEKAGFVLKSAIKSIPIALATYAPDGGWPEGPSYWGAARHTAMTLAAMKSALGTDFGLSAAPGFNRTGHFRIHFTSPTLQTFNFGDASARSGGTSAMFWLAGQYKEPVYAWHQHQYLTQGGRDDVFNLIWYQPPGPSPEKAGWPLDAYFRATEAAMLRSSWSDSNALYLGIKGGQNNNGDGHRHLDLGGFVFDALGQRWASDLGGEDYNIPNYFLPFRWARWSYYRTRTESHNTVVIDNDSQDFRGLAPITAHVFKPAFSYVKVNMTGAYPAKLKRMERGAAMVQRAHIVIQDDVSAIAPVDVLWGMVTEGEVLLNGATAELIRKDAAVTARILSPAGAKFEVMSTEPPPRERPNPGTRKLVVRLPGKTASVRIVVAMTPHRSGAPAQKLEWKDRPLAQW